jgi:hypothetical protein
MRPFCEYRQDMIWNATPHPMASATALIAPKPDFAVGFRCSRTRTRAKRARKTSTTPNVADADLEPFSEGFIQELIQRPGIYLKPHVNASKLPSSIILPDFPLLAAQTLVQLTDLVTVLHSVL